MNKTMLNSLLIMGLLIATNMQAQVYESARTGNWTTANTWVNGLIPPANVTGITIKINPNHTVTFNDNGNNYQYGQDVTFDINGTLNINGWGGFRVGNNAEFLVTGTMRNGQNITLGQNATFKIWNTFNVASVFLAGNNAEFIIYEDGTMRNTASFEAGNNTGFVIDGQLINSGYKFEVGSNTSMEIGEDGSFNSTSTFGAGDNFKLKVNGSLLNTGNKFATGDNANIHVSEDSSLENRGSMTFGDELTLNLEGTLVNSGYTFQAADDADIYIAESGSMTTTTTMAFGEELLLFIEGDLNIAGYNFSFGDDSEIFLLGNMNVDNGWVFKPANGDNIYFYVCNGEPTPINIPQGSIIVENDCSVLPVELIYFDAQATTGNIVTLNWITASETNSDYFLVERSLDGNSWDQIAFIHAAGNSNQLVEYTYDDENVGQGICYYRLKQVDFDGTYEYFGPVVIQVSMKNEFELLKVERVGEYIRITAEFEKGANLTMINTIGQVIASQHFSTNTTNLTLPCSRDHGTIMIHYSSPSTGIVHSSKYFIR